MDKTSDVGRFVLALLVPVVLYVGLTMTIGDRLAIDPNEFLMLAALFSVTMGFTIIAGLCGRYVLLVVFLYFPVMLVLLGIVATNLPSIFHGDYP